MSIFFREKSLHFFMFSARCDLIQPIKSRSREGKNNLLMSLWQARKIAFVQQANNIRHMSPTKTKSGKHHDSYRCHARLFLFSSYLLCLSWMNQRSCFFSQKSLRCFLWEILFFDKIHKFSKNIFLTYIFTILLVCSFIIIRNHK